MPTALMLAAGAGLGAGLTIQATYAGPAGRSRLYLFKPLTTGLIIATAVAALPDPAARYSIAILAGLVCSLAGDVFLMLPGDRFLPGLASFLLAHLAYLFAFTSGLAPVGLALAALPLAGVGLVVLAYLWPGLDLRLRLPVAIYVAAIVIMAAAALARWIWLNTTPALLGALGALLLVILDFVLAVDRFRRPFRAAQGALLSTYFAAQVLIALSVTRTG